MNPNPNEDSTVTASTLDELRWHPDAVRLISDKLGVKDMGPADHIRTKHEVKAFVESGGRSDAEQLLKHAKTRRELAQTTAQRMMHQERQGHTP